MSISQQPVSQLTHSCVQHQECAVFAAAAPVQLKGICPRCSQPVTSLQARDRMPDGSYMHASEADCLASVPVRAW
eukprot:409929-Rhodomonas_salina.1